MSIPNDGSVHEADWQPIESLVSKISKEKQKFERLSMSKENLLKMVSIAFLPPSKNTTS